MALVELVKRKLTNTCPLLDAIDKAETIARTARRHRQGLSGGGFYATKFADSHAEALNTLRELQSKVETFSNDEATKALEAAGKHVHAFFGPRTDGRERGRIKNQLLILFKASLLPMMQKGASHSPSDNLFPLELVKNTRSYIERIAAQACGCYDLEWFDGAAVMARRLLETLIIELYEARKIDHKIKNPDGTFQYLSGLISVLRSETAFNVGRNAKKALPILKDLGDQSAHNRRYIARQQDLDAVKRELRVTIEELVHLIEYK